MPKIPTPLPTMDWRLQIVLDGVLVDPDARCQWCDRRIRWINVLEHTDFPTTQNAGSCCAQRLCNDYDMTAERNCLARSNRRRAFLKKWKTSKNNPSNLWRHVLSLVGKVTVTVFVHDGRYKIFFAGKKGDKCCAQSNYATQREALDAAFVLVEQLNDRPITEVRYSSASQCNRGDHA